MSDTTEKDKQSGENTEQFPLHEDKGNNSPNTGETGNERGDLRSTDRAQGPVNQQRGDVTPLTLPIDTSTPATGILEKTLQIRDSLSPISSTPESWADATETEVRNSSTQSMPVDTRPNEEAIARRLLDRLLLKVQAIMELYEDIIKLDDRKTTLCEVECYEQMISEEWKEFNELQASMLVDINIDHEYYRSDGYQRATSTRRSSLLNMSRLKARLGARSNPNDPSTRPSASHNLERITLRKFSGDFAAWKEFSDLYQNMVGQTSLSKVEKLVRLTNALTGPAAELLKTFPITEDSYDQAWEKLRNVYENPRLIAQTLFERVLNLPKIKKASAKSIAANRSTAKETFDQLATSAGISRENLGEQFIVHLLLNSLDAETRKDLEVKVGRSTRFTTINELVDFLDSTVRGLSVSGAGEKAPTTSQSTQQKGTCYQVSQEGDVPPPKKNPATDCACCSGSHFVAKCSKYRSLSIPKKRELIVKEHLCYNCLGTHNVRACKSTKSCLRCEKKHHTSICEKGSSGNQPAPATSSSESSQSTQEKAPRTVMNLVNRDQKPTTEASTPHSINSSELRAVHHHASKDNQPSVLLATARARVYSSTGIYVIARLLIDQGSELTFIAEHLVNQLKLSRASSTIPLTGIGNTNSGHTRGVVSISLESTYEPYQRVDLRAHVLGKLTTRLPSFTASSFNKKSIRQLQLADENFMKTGPIDMLIGADNYGKITRHQSLTPERSQLVGQLTIFGWTLSGPLNCTDCSKGRILTALRDDSNEQLLQLLQKFWVQEELPKTSRSITEESSPEDQACELHFKTTHERDSTGRYIIRLPLRASPAELGESKATALRQLYSVNRRLKSDASYNQLYSEFINEYESLQHMRRAPTTPEPSTTYYLPHHGVLKAESLSTKLRVVFNGSSKTSTGVSLNDILYTGEKLQVDAMDVLTYMRRHKYVFGTDISKMFRQIRVHQDDWDLQRILWINKKEETIAYQLTTVTYGLNCSPWLSLRVLQQLAFDEGQQFPKAVPALTQGRYVDDIYGGAETESELEETIQDLQQLCMAGGFPLAKWASNKPEVLDRLGLSTATSSTISFEESVIKVLGVCWHPSTDTFQYKSRKFDSTKLTKRTLLSEIAQIFDPLGFISPVIIKAKVLIQELWCLKLSWDDPLPQEYSQRWNAFREELAQLNELAIPRWLGTSTHDVEIQLHGFSDASTTAMGAVVYIRTQKLNEEPIITLVCAKTRVAPIKRLTIPRLELSAALMLTELASYVQETLETENLRIILWTDSSVALAWINSHPSRWKEYVHNRVVKIQETLPSAQWKHVSGPENPADCASRGISTSQLVNHQLWWTGPSWLQKPEENWPQPSTKESTSRETSTEEKPSKALPAAARRVNDLTYLLDRYSKFSKALQVTATIKRTVNRFRHQPVPDSPILTTVELEEARLFWVKLIQHQYFQQEIELLRENHQLPRNHHLIKLTPIIDEVGILRLGGRLTNAPLSPEQIHPIILPKGSRMSELIIRNAHLKTLHGGTQQTLSYVREKYWIIGGRPTVKSVIQRCLRCTRFRAQRAYQLMGQLPASRVTPSRPFQHTGVDYAGPVPVLKWTGKGAQTQSGYITVFVCFATSAIHLELVSRQSTEAFIAAYKRFTGRRGIPEVMYSDRGAAFIGAAGVLKRSAEAAEQDEKDIINYIVGNGTQWKFIPPRAAHFGGKWEAGVKSMKHHLKRVIGDSRLTFEELTTLLAQIEATLNSRPMSQLSDDPTDSTALTPGHFLTGGTLTTVPEPSRLHESRVKPPRWKWITQKTQDFWNQWYREYIQRHQAISKWRETNQNIQQGQLVLVSEDGQTPSRWPLALVIKRYVGKDGLVRVVDLRCNKKVIRRSIHKLCILPVMPFNILDIQPEEELEIAPDDEAEPAPESPTEEEEDEPPPRHSTPDDDGAHASKRIRLG